MSEAADQVTKPVAAIFRTPVFNPSERFIQNQAAVLSRYRPVVVGVERKGDVLPVLREGMILPGGAMERLLFRLRGRGGGIEARLRAVRTALLHAHFGTDGLLVLPLAQALKVPLVTTLHGYDAFRTDRAMLLSGRLSWMRYAIGRERLIRGGNLFLAVSDALRDQAIARGYPAERVLTHYNGIDLDFFRPGEAPAEPGLILHVGRLVEKKGATLLIDALARVKKATLAIVGEGPLRGALERQVQGAGLGDRVRFLGSLPPDEVAGWMRRAAILAAPSLTARDGDSEGLPNVVVEAAASGLPVVASRHSGIPEAVVDGETGLLIPENDIAALTGALAALLESEGMGREMGVASRTLAERKFDRVRLNARLEDIYDDLVQRFGQHSL
jgi:colanic acid/amylovoran biosynthesis glycosyltransferase